MQTGIGGIGQQPEPTLSTQKGSCSPTTLRIITIALAALSVVAATFAIFMATGIFPPIMPLVVPVVIASTAFVGTVAMRMLGASSKKPQNETKVSPPPSPIYNPNDNSPPVDTDHGEIKHEIAPALSNPFSAGSSSASIATTPSTTILSSASSSFVPSDTKMAVEPNGQISRALSNNPALAKIVEERASGLGRLNMQERLKHLSLVGKLLQAAQVIIVLDNYRTLVTNMLLAHKDASKKAIEMINPHRRALRLGTRYAKKRDWSKAQIQLKKPLHKSAEAAEETKKSHQELQTQTEALVKKLTDTAATLSQEQAKPLQMAISILQDAEGMFKEASTFWSEKQTEITQQIERNQANPRIEFWKELVRRSSQEWIAVGALYERAYPAIEQVKEKTDQIDLPSSAETARAIEEAELLMASLERSSTSE